MASPGVTAWARSTVMEPGPHPQSRRRIPGRRYWRKNAAPAPVRRANTARLQASSTWYGRSVPGCGSDMCLSF
jgi:hypothetical protein